MKLICSTVIRAAPADTLHGKLYTVDTETRDIECISELSGGLGRSNERGGDRGYRGIVVLKNKIIVAISQGFLLVDRNSLQQTSIIRYPDVLGSIHEICEYNRSIWATSTSKDCIVELDMSLKVKKVWEISIKRSRASKTIRSGRIADNDKNHINSVSAFAGRLVFAGISTPLFDFDTLRVVTPNDGRTHNFYEYKDMILVNRTGSNQLGIIKNSRMRSIDLPAAKRSGIKCHNRDVAALNWGRGLTRHKNLVFTGSSPARIITIDLNDKKVIDEIWLEDDVRHVVHGLEILCV